MELATLCYASQAVKPDHLIREDLMQIINEAVSFNAKRDIFGVLYYGNGYFFQCLEGEKKEVETLYQHILKDKRHKNVQLIYQDEIDYISFCSWNMKFAPYSKELCQFFDNTSKEISVKKFNPYLIQPEQVPDFLDLLYKV